MSEPREIHAALRPVDAPPVVATMVVHDPGPWFDEVVGALAAQDYPNLQTLFFLTDACAEEVGARIRTALPQAHNNRGGAAAATVAPTAMAAASTPRYSRAQLSNRSLQK